MCECLPCCESSANHHEFCSLIRDKIGGVAAVKPGSAVMCITTHLQCTNSMFHPCSTGTKVRSPRLIRLFRLTWHTESICSITRLQQHVECTPPSNHFWYSGLLPPRRGPSAKVHPKALKSASKWTFARSIRLLHHIPAHYPPRWHQLVAVAHSQQSPRRALRLRTTFVTGLPWHCHLSPKPRQL